MGEWYNRFDADPLSMPGIMRARDELREAAERSKKQMVRWARRKAARAGTRGRRGALSSREVDRLCHEQVARVVNEFRQEGRRSPVCIVGAHDVLDRKRSEVSDG